MTEKGIDQLRADLAAVDADCADQIRKTVHENYHHFIQACQVAHCVPLRLRCYVEPAELLVPVVFPVPAVLHCAC